MSGAIWGTPLIGNMLVADPALDIYKICDLNNWIRQNIPSGIIDYDPATRRNEFSFTMIYAAFEAFCYEMPVEPNCYYTLRMTLLGEFEEEVNNPNTHMWVAVCSERPQQIYFEQQFNIALAKSRATTGIVNRISLSFFSGELSMVYLWIDLSAITDRKVASYIIENISFNEVTGDPIHYAQKPFNLNILGGDIWNFIAVEPGAWFYSIFDDRNTHHVYFLAGNEFKLLEFQDADGNGVIPHKEYHSTPITIEGKKYHALYLSRTVEAVCPFPTQYYPIDELPTDEDVYKVLSKCVREWTPYERGDVLGLWALRNLLSVNMDDETVNIDDVRALLNGYTVEEYQNPYLDDPHGENPNFGIED